MKRVFILIFAFVFSLILLSGCNTGAKMPVSGSEDIISSQTSKESGEITIVSVTADEPVAAVVGENGKYGYINTSGEWVIAPQYEQAYPFCNDRATVCTDRSGTQWLIIDKQNNIVRQFDGVYVVPVSGMSYGLGENDYTIINDMLIITRDDPYVGFDQKYGFADSNGEIVLEPATAEVKAFQEELAAVNFGTQGEPSWGYVNQSGSTVIPAQFKSARSFSNGLAYTEKEYDPNNPGMDSGFINTSGDLVIHPEYQTDENGFPVCLGYNNHVSDFSGGYAVASVYTGDTVGTVLGVIDTKGNVVWHDTGEENFNSGGPTMTVFGDGLYCVRGNPDANGDCPEGFIDMTGAVVIAPTIQWRVSGIFHDGLCQVYTVGSRLTFGFLDKSGNLAVEIKYRAVKDFSCGYAAVSEDGSTFKYIDKTGTAISGSFTSYGAPFTV